MQGSAPIIDRMENNAKTIIDQWPGGRKALAEDCGLDLTAVHAWVKRNQIAAGYDVRIVEAATRCGLGVTYEMLARQREKGPAA